MRIITGKYKGRRFDIPHSFKARPTTDFAKENIFNVLNGYIVFEGATALDLFSGTGSISLEFLSRGCSQVISVEGDKDHHAFIRQCLKKLDDNNCIPLRGDVFRFIKSCHTQFDVIFADPPYTLENLQEIPTLIRVSNILKSEGVFVLEHGNKYNFETEPGFVEHRAYGSVNFSIFQTV
ncbi:MAG: RsmD family RNA methyltransferase [Prevotella sp.]|nr:RsmD family RNA methyltransferase [Prevotella sp.]